MKKRVLICIILAIIAIWLLSFVTLLVFKDWPARGQFGDLFGSVNALFSGLAFAGLIYAILLQKQELSLQREELRLQREEMAASRKELAAQVAAQEALFKATVAQIRVAAAQSRIEAAKVKLEHGRVDTSPVQRSISEHADNIEKLAEDLIVPTKPTQALDDL